MAKFLLVFGLWFMVAGNATAFNPCDNNYTSYAQRYKKGLFFIAQKCGHAPNYVLGTMHSDDPKIIEMHKNAIVKLDKSNAALFEIKMDAAAITETLQAMYFNPQSGLTLQKVVGDNLYKRFLAKIDILEEGQELLKPWAAAIILQYPDSVADGVVLDMRLQKYAEGKNIKVAGLEKPSEQLGIFDNIPMDKQVEMLNELLDKFAESKKLEAKMLNAYMARNLNALNALVPESINLNNDPKAAKELLDMLIYQRNKRMAERSEPYFTSGNAFMAVGALHLPGEEGILQLLENKGYRIEALDQ